MSENQSVHSICYICIKCNKNYASQQSLCNHNKKFHKIESENNHTFAVDTPQNSTNLHNKSEKLACKYCERVLSRNDSLNRHEKKCKQKQKITNKYEEENNDLKNIIKNLQDKMNSQSEMLQNLIKIVNEQCKVHPKTLQKMNRSLLNSNNNTNSNVNNGTINNDNKVITNNIKIIKFGDEDLSELLTEKEILQILNKKFLSIEESIKTVHFNKKRPEYQNICITNLKDDLAYVYNGEKFEAVSKSMMLNELIDIHTENIEVTLDNYRKKLNKQTINILEELIIKISDNDSIVFDENNCKKFKNYKSYKANDVKLLIYNESGKNNKVINLKYTKLPINKPKEIEV